MLSIDDILEQFEEATQDELSCTNFSEWSLAVSGANFKDVLDSLSTQELRELSEELQEGRELAVTIDLSEAILAQVDDLLESRSEDEEDEDDSDEEDSGSYSDED